MPRGRPRSFNREDALKQALGVFWAKGYENTTLMDLQEAMGGLTTPSVYAAFGSKEALFREAVDLYSRNQGEPVLKALNEGATARASIEGLLQEVVRAFCPPQGPRGCLLVIGAMTSAPENSGVRDYVREQRQRRQKIISQRIRRGVTDGDVPRGVDAGAIATFYVTVIEGLAVQARDGVSSKNLRAVVGAAVAGWDEIIAKSRR